MKKIKFMSKLVASMMVTTLMLTGCAGNTTEQANSTTGDVPATTEKKEEAPVELSFYITNGPVNDFERVMDKANAIIEEEINATVNLVMIDGASYADKMNLMINSGDKFDLCFTANWGGINFFENAAKGAYADLTDLLPQYAPESYSRIPEGLWEGVKVDDRIYGVVNYQQWGVAARKGFKFREDIANEVGFDWKAVKGKSTLEAMNMIEPFLAAGLEKHPDMIGWETSSVHSFFANEPLMWDMESIGDVTSPGWVRFDEPTMVINQFATPEFAEYCNIMRDWYQKGYVRKDGATVKDTAPDRKAGKMLAEVVQGWPDSIDFPGNADVAKMSMCTVDVAPAVTVSTTRTVIPATAGSTAAVAINAQSPNIEKSLELIELLNTNDELYMLMTQGEEGVDYVYGEDGTVSLVEGKYNFNWNEWQLAQSYSPDFTRALYNKNEAGDLQKESQSFVYKADREAEVSPVTGFTFDPTPVKTQLANCTSVITEMIPALSNGCLDPAKSLPEFLQRLDTAGVNDIIAEKQAQLDAWKAQ
ncbi:MAG: ABC transporter substrate-binding protein [Niameybacter sp.]